MKFGSRKCPMRGIPAIAALGAAGCLGVKVTVTFDIAGSPTADWTDPGTELLPPVSG
jgi:hypothetical protein